VKQPPIWTNRIPNKEEGGAGDKVTHHTTTNHPLHLGERRFGLEGNMAVRRNEERGQRVDKLDRESQGRCPDPFEKVLT